MQKRYFGRQFDPAHFHWVLREGVGLVVFSVSLTKLWENEMSEDFLQIAANMFAGYGVSGDPGLLETNLCDELREINRLAQKDGGELRSRQVIAQVINQFRKENLNVRIYGEK